MERPRPTGGGDPEIFVHVKLSNRELMHSLGISCRGEQSRAEDKGGGGEGVNIVGTRGRGKQGIRVGETEERCSGGRANE